MNVTTINPFTLFPTPLLFAPEVTGGGGGGDVGTDGALVDEAGDKFVDPETGGNLIDPEA